jgi:putative peptidoglycan lipid II flippase
LAILAEPLIATLFLYGAMTTTDVMQAAAALQAYSLGVLTFMLIKVLAPGFFARQDLKTPVRIAIICMVVNMVLNLILIWPMQHVGLALATSLASMLNTGLLLRGLYRAGVYKPAPGWWLFILRLLAACAAMLALVFWLNEPSSEWFAWGWQRRVWEVSILVFGGVLVFAGTLFATGIRMRHLRR